MSQYFQKMNETYIEKHYPKRSVFEAVAKATKSVGIGVYIFFGLVLAGSLAGLLWSVNSLITYKQSGDTDMADVGMVVCIVFAIFALISILVIAITIRRGRRRAADWLIKSAKNSKLSEAEIQDFERQAFSPDSYILKLLDGINAVVSGGKDGILTKDFIYLADTNLTVIRCKDLVSACLVEDVIYVGSQQQRRPVHYLSIRLLSRSGAEALAEVSPEAGHALIEMLSREYPGIISFDGQALAADKYEKHKAELAII